MFTDPIELEDGVGTVTATLPRVSTGTNTASYKDANFVSTSELEESIEFTVSHNYGKRNRRVARVNVNKKVIGPTAMPPATMSVYLVVDSPTSGFSLTEIRQSASFLLSFLGSIDGTDVIASPSLVRILEGES